MMSEWLSGIAGGIGIGLLIATWISRRDHEAWCRIVDRQSQLLENIAERVSRPDDPADWWKQN